MSNPIVTITNVSAYKISDEPTKNTCIATFKFDQPVKAYTVNILGVSWDTGTVADAHDRTVQGIKNYNVGSLKNKTIADLKAIDTNTIITAEIDNTECYQEGENKVTIYGQALDGTWT